MSVQPEEREAVDLPHHGDMAFGALMDALAPEEETPAPAGEGAAAGSDSQQGTDGAAGRDDAPVVRTGEAGQAGGAPDPAAAGGSGDDSQPADGAAAGGAEQPAAPSGEPAPAPSAGTVETAVVLPQLGELSTKLEENVTKAYQKQAYDQAREEYGNYFDALEKHPRLLVGTQVPAIGKEGMETLRDSNDAKEWQEAVRSLLVEEIRANAQVKLEESQDFLQTAHASIDLFKNNPDLIPGTKGFNRKLADQFASMMEPYEVRVDGKLQGYSIPVQPIIEKLRAQLASQTPAVAPPSQPAAPAVAPARSAAPEPPQAGIPSKASSGAEKEDFSTLFGTIGLPNLQI